MTDDRRQRLKALAARAGRTKKPENDEDGATAEDKSEAAKPSISFRNYAPADKSLSGEQEQSREGDGDSSQPSAAKKQRTEENDASLAAPVSSSEALQNALAEAKRDPVIASAPEARPSNAPDSVATMAPKKINWDLKRDISDKLAKLEKRTQKAIVRILKERLEMEAADAAEEDGSDGEGASDLD